MPNFHTQKQVGHSAQKMFALVADIERYPQFVPMCEALTIRTRQEKEGNVLLVADMTVGYKLIRESFTTQVYLQPEARRIDVHYVDGPFKYLENRWQFLPPGVPAPAAGQRAEKTLPARGGVAAATAGNGNTGHKLEQRFVSADVPEIAPGAGKKAESALTKAEAEACLVDFYIDYAFKNPLLAALMGTMFDIAFRKFTQAFETRADEIYGIGG